MYSIPFTADKPTHLFREMNKSAIKQIRYIVALDPLIKASFALTLTDRLNMKYKITSVVVSFDNKSFGLTSDIFNFRYQEPNPPLCPAPIFEDVHIWCEDPFLFIWSCVAGREGTDHEEALLIIEKDLGYGRTQEQVLSVASQLLPKDLLALINFEQHIKLQKGPAGGFFACAQPSLKWAPYILITVVL